MKKTIKKTLSITIALIITLASVTACAGNVERGDEPEYFTEGLEYAMNADLDSYRVTGMGQATDTEVVIPDKYNGFNVTQIGEKAFSEVTSITAIRLPAYTTLISDEAFYGCTGLSRIVIPDSVESIGEMAFWGCVSMESVIFGDAVTQIGEEAFFGCINIVEIVFPKSLTKPGNFAFINCKKLKTVYYTGSEQDKENITGEDFFNAELYGANWYYYSATEPTVAEGGAQYNGNFWHYDDNNNPVIWELAVYD